MEAPVPIAGGLDTCRKQITFGYPDTGNRFIADAGANPRELMARMGYDSVRAALIYLHSSAERQRTAANEVGKNARAALRQPQDEPKRSGTRKARNRREAS